MLFDVILGLPFRRLLITANFTPQILLEWNISTWILQAPKTSKKITKMSDNSNETAISEQDRSQIAELRQQIKGHLTEYYDTDYNLLRWLQGHNYNMSAIVPKLKYHLRIRDIMNLDALAEKERNHPVRNDCCCCCCFCRGCCCCCCFRCFCCCFCFLLIHCCSSCCCSCRYCFVLLLSFLFRSAVLCCVVVLVVAFDGHGTSSCCWRGWCCCCSCKHVCRCCDCMVWYGIVYGCRGWPGQYSLKEFRCMS